MRVGVLAVVALVLLSSANVFGADETDYRVGPKDLIEIKVFQIADLNLERRVAENGTIDLPLLGPVSVAGLTTSEIQDRLEAILTTKYVNRADVFVNIKEYANKPITFLGAVGKPGTLPISGKWRLLQAITAVGGISSGAGKRIFILRTAENGLTDSLTVNVEDLFQGSASIWNIPIFASDIVNVPAKTPVKVFLLGEVKATGAVELDSDDTLTLLTVLAKAGGLTDRASHTIRIKRKGLDGREVETRVNYNRVLAGKAPDPTLLPGDLILVKESVF